MSYVTLALWILAVSLGAWLGYLAGRTDGVRSERKRQAARDAAVVAKRLSTRAANKGLKFPQGGIGTATFTDPLVFNSEDGVTHLKVSTLLDGNHLPPPMSRESINLVLDERTEARP